MKDQNRNRLAIITGRYEQRLIERTQQCEHDFEAQFERARREVIRPAMEEVAEELTRAGHSPSITLDGCKETPSIELRLGIRGASSSWANLVAYCVIRRRDRPEVLAFLDMNQPMMDLIRYPYPRDILANQVEQLLVDAVEHIFACNGI